MSTRRPLLLFFVLAYTISWLCWAPLLLARNGLGFDRAPQYLHLFGALGPALAAVITARSYGGRAAQTSLLRRVVHWRVPAIWHLVAWAGPFVLLFAAVAAARLVAAVPWDANELGRSAEYPDLPRSAYWAASIVFYGFGEEIGWRGFALPHLQRKWNASVATLALSIFWALWHLPLFGFAPGLSRMGLPEVAGWYLSILTGAVLLTWLMNTTGSVLIAAVFHGTMDIVFISPGSALVTNILGSLVTILGLIVLIVAGPRYLSRKGKVVADETGIVLLVARA